MAGESGSYGVIEGGDGCRRCFWCGDDPLYQAYHDEEWGRPVTGDIRLFEKICLEGFQAGLSWLTILRKRENFRRAFADFDPEAVARFGEADVARLLSDASIIRHEGKIRAAINNASRALQLQEEAGSIAAFVWSFEPAADERPSPVTKKALLDNPTTAASKALSKALKKRGWQFVGPTTAYAFMQAMGLVNDHIEGCAIRSACEEARRGLARPEITEA